MSVIGSIKFVAKLKPAIHALVAIGVGATVTGIVFSLAGFGMCGPTNNMGGLVMAVSGPLIPVASVFPEQLQDFVLMGLLAAMFSCITFVSLRLLAWISRISTNKPESANQQS